MFLSIEDLQSSFGGQTEAGTASFVINTQSLYVHTTGCDMVKDITHALR